MFTIPVIKAQEVTHIEVTANAQYAESSILNGKPDVDGDMPGLRGEIWEADIELVTGRIEDWPEGTTASINYKVADRGLYTLTDGEGFYSTKEECYVPYILCPGGKGYGDYIIMNVDKDGYIENWDVQLDEWNNPYDQ